MVRVCHELGLLNPWRSLHIIYRLLGLSWRYWRRRFLLTCNFHFENKEDTDVFEWDDIIDLAWIYELSKIYINLFQQHILALLLLSNKYFNNSFFPLESLIFENLNTATENLLLELDI
jgi:hypothetical protein